MVLHMQFSFLTADIASLMQTSVSAADIGLTTDTLLPTAADIGSSADVLNPSYRACESSLLDFQVQSTHSY
mgnify:CR=1 FL=1